jgi:hypothetical protein
LGSVICPTSNVNVRRSTVARPATGARLQRLSFLPCPSFPVLPSQVLRVLDQAEVAERATIDRRLTERINDWISGWGLVVEQAGFTTICPDKNVLHTTQLEAKTLERADAMRMLIAGGLDAESALVMIGAERQPAAK